MFRRRSRRKHFYFPFWIFAILFFSFMGDGWWAWMFPFFLFWCFGPMVWGMVSGSRHWEEEREWKDQPAHIPADWQTPPQPKPAPRTPAQITTVGQPPRSMTGLPTTCAACGGPVNPTTVAWHHTSPHCGYCGTKL